MPTATETAAAISPISKENAAPEVQPLLDKLTHGFGKVPAFFGTMARVPEAFATFVPFYSAVIEHGTVERKYKELAYLKASLINGCEYCFRAHSASERKMASPMRSSKRSPSFTEVRRSMPRKRPCCCMPSA